jgi:hypothetical protein
VCRLRVLPQEAQGARRPHVSDQDARWVGVGVGVNPDPSGGWRYPVLGVADRPELPPSEITLLQRLMRVDVTPNASEFLR